MRVELAILAAVVGLAGPVAAQVPARLTLDDAITIARERNPEYQRAVHTLNAQGAQLRAGWGGFFPSVSARMSFNGSSSTRVTGEDDFGQPVSLPTPIDFQSSSASQSLSAGVTLFDGLRNVNSLRAARASADGSEASRDAVANRVDAETTRRFYEALRTARLIALEDQLLTSAREQLARTQRLFRTAGATQEDVLGAEGDVASQELALERARGEADKARLAVIEYLGISEHMEFEAVGELPDVWDPAVLDVDELVSVALRVNPSVRQLENTTRGADLRATAERGSRWPSISVNASYSRSISLGSYDALFEINPRNRGLGFGMTVDLPLFTGFQTSARIANASLESRNAHETLRAGRLQAEREVRAALIDLRNAHRGRDLAQRTADLSSERLRLARQRYAIGAITFANLQLLIDRAAQEERGLINARFQLAQSIVALEERLGQPVRP
ncbi:MAG TPA: TolC family protein [Gemmatimonadales bacterium]